MTEIYAEITYDLVQDSFEVSGTAKDPKKLVSSYLRTQVGAGEDHSPAADIAKYTISLRLDLTSDAFFVCSDCGNRDLMGGILLRFIQMKEKPNETERP